MPKFSLIDLSLTEENCQDLARVQKTVFKVILGTKYDSYKKSPDYLGERRENLCLNFAIKCTHNSVVDWW